MRDSDHRGWIVRLAVARSLHRDVMQPLQDDVIAFNRTSCALSNCCDEHPPSKEYVRTIRRDVAAAWQELSLSADRLLLAKAQRKPRPVEPSPEELSS